MSGSGRAKLKTQNDVKVKKVKTQAKKGLFQVQVDSLESLQSKLLI